MLPPVTTSLTTQR